MNEERKFDQQDHPLKNTDQAFVQVGKNGEPVVPKTEAEEPQQSGTENNDQPVVYDRP